MGLLRSLSEPERRLVAADKEKNGIDHAISYAQRLKAASPAKATRPTPANTHDEPTDGELEEIEREVEEEDSGNDFSFDDI